MYLASGESLRSLWEGLAARRGTHAFLVFQACDGSIRRFSYAEFAAYMNRMSNFFLAEGVRVGERVAVQLYNSPEIIAAIFALAQIGAVSVPLNVQHRIDESASLIRRCEASRVLVDPDFQEYYDGREGSYPVERLYVSHAGEGVLSEASVDFDAQVALQPDELSERRQLHAQDVAELLFTSGTTAEPKGVMITHANFILSGQYGCWQHAMRPDDVFLSTMPAFHSNFQLAALTPVLAAGATLVFVAKYSARRFWAQIREHGATLTQMVSMMLRTSMMQPRDLDEQRHRLRAIQYYLPVAEEEKLAFEERFSVRLQNCYGLTESICWSATCLPFEEAPWPSVGRPGLGYAVEVRREDGSRAAPFEEGGILIQGVPGQSLMKGYFKDEAATRLAMDEAGWLRTGDTGYFDDAGRLYFVDRDSNMIKRAGENVSASEVEAVLERFPGVREAAVVGVSDPIRDQAVKAFLVMEPGVEGDAEAVSGFCRQHLADYKVPTELAFVESLPKTSLGKLAKRFLR